MMAEPDQNHAEPAGSARPAHKEVDSGHAAPDRVDTEWILRENEARYRRLAENVPHLIWVIDEAGEVTYVNERWRQYTGLSADQSRSDGWVDCVAEMDREEILAAWASARETGLPFGMDLRLRRSDGEYRWFLLRAVPLPNGKVGHGSWLGTGTDIHEQRLEADRQRFLSELDEQMRSAHTPDEIVGRVLRTLGERLHASRCLYSEYEHVDGEVIVSVRQDFREPGVASNVGVYKGSCFGAQITEELRRGDSVAVIDVITDPRTAARASHYVDVLHTRSFTASSVNKSGFESAALTAIDSDSPRVWRDDEMALVKAVLERTWLALDAARYYREIQRAAAAQHAFVRDVLSSVTDGRLQVCAAAADLPAALPEASPRVDLGTGQGICDLRHRTRNLAVLLGFDLDRIISLETAVGEAAMNAVVHASCGLGWICCDGQDSIQVWIQDQGSGIALDRLPNATLARGYSTASTLGHGFKLIIGMIDRVYLLTGPEGTTVVLAHGSTQPAIFEGIEGL